MLDFLASIDGSKPYEDQFKLFSTGNKEFSKYLSEAHGYKDTYSEIDNKVKKHDEWDKEFMKKHNSKSDEEIKM
jgi:hypothetical protein